MSVERTVNISEPLADTEFCLQDFLEATADTPDLRKVLRSLDETELRRLARKFMDRLLFGWDDLIRDMLRNIHAERAEESAGGDV